MSVEPIDFAMCHEQTTNHEKTLQLLSILLVLLLVPCAHGQVSRIVPVNIYGDGDPRNGVEDNREQVFGGRHKGSRVTTQRFNAGTIKCDGKVRGTGMVVDTSEYASGLGGAVILTAAHVLYDLDKKQRFRHCDFHFLALGELPGYRARVDLKNARLGEFDPLQTTGAPEFGEGDWAFLYVPKPWKSFDPEGVITLREFSRLQMESFQQNGGEMGLIAYDSAQGVISLSRNCTVIESSASDLGGGAWKGQLLDDCDSADGASGGGIIAILGDNQYLVGIRSGSHWSHSEFPISEYPEGPPQGAVWDQHSNTNFGRAIDARLLRELADFIAYLGLEQSVF